MVSPNSPSNPNTNNNIHQFLISNPAHYETQQSYDAYGVDLRNFGPYPPHHSLNIPLSMTNDPQLNQHQDHQNQKLSLSLRSPIFPFPSSTQYSNLQEEKKCFDNNPSHEYSSSNHQSFYGTESCFSTTTTTNSSVGSSRYLKPTQSLLEEIVSLNWKDLESTTNSYARKLSASGQNGSLRLCSELKAELISNGLLMDKQDLQATLAKLISLLEEVERRYGHYHQQLEEVVSSFEMNAGLGSGKSYTALVLNAMSAHFSNLKDAILAQIYSTRKKILNNLPKMNAGFSQLSLFDKENNRIALQQLGMIATPRQTWRPIRGLPETSVMILRTWLFEHFLHPYPNDNEKLMLASQTGLSKNQVSNWFINARVRLWKPMIEEMYKEEFAESSEDSNL
uniref:BEL1-like homeodomain protein 11 n=1 Tax=Erigeron canadensis TaxID=72917 RepID=UPI001CB95ACC|nr:BEL1-like homeodomain protein 11 [Erigeron canadensis]